MLREDAEYINSGENPGEIKKQSHREKVYDRAAWRKLLSIAQKVGQTYKYFYLMSNMNFVKPCVRITLHDAACLCEVVYVIFLTCVMFVQFDCIVLRLKFTYMYM